MQKYFSASCMDRKDKVQEDGFRRYYNLYVYIYRNKLPFLIQKLNRTAEKKKDKNITTNRRTETLR